MIKILFLEDEPTILEVTLEYMKMKGYLVTCVSDINEAICELKKQEFNLAVLDIMLPSGSGLDVLKYIKNNKNNIGTIMLTALSDENTELTAFNLMADDYVTKPFSPLLLLKRIEAILRRMATNNIEYMHNEGLVINDDTYQVFYNRKNLKFTLSEFLLLQALFKESRRAFSREQLILKIFNEDYYGNDRIIDAHVKNIRKKLPKNFIKTIMGVGYQFDMEVK